MQLRLIIQVLSTIKRNFKSLADPTSFVLFDTTTTKDIVQVQKNAEDYYSAFSFQAFKLQNAASLWVHCNLSLCYDSECCQTNGCPTTRLLTNQGKLKYRHLKDLFSVSAKINIKQRKIKKTALRRRARRLQHILLEISSVHKRFRQQISTLMYLVQK